MNLHLSDVILFQKKFGFEIPNSLSLLKPDLYNFRVAFLYEELDEFIDGCNMHTDDVHPSDGLLLAIDSLIDLMYITLGTMNYHGINETYEMTVDITHKDYFYLHFNDEEFSGSIHLPRKEITDDLIRILKANIFSYKTAHYKKNKMDAINALSLIYKNCINGLSAIGIPEPDIKYFWDDVQRANMSKVKTLNTEITKRGIPKYDVTKPADWIAPDTAKMITICELNKQ